MDKTNRPLLFVVDGNEIVIPEPTEEQLLALAAERVSGKVTPQEFLDFPEVREAMKQLYKTQKLVEAKALLAAENAAKREVLEAARAKLIADITDCEARAVQSAHVVVPEPVVAVEKTMLAKPVSSPATQGTEIARPPMPALGQGEVLSDYRALGIAQDEKDPQTGVAYRRFAKPEDLKRYQDSNSGNWWCMVTGRLVPEDLTRVVSAVLVCEKSHAERLAKKLVDPMGKEQHPHFIRGTLDWLKDKADMLAKPSSATQESTHPVSKKSPERLAEEMAEKENIRADVGEINSMEQMLTDGFKLLRVHQSNTGQFRFTRAMLSQNVGNLLNAFEACLPERFPNRGSVEALRAEIGSLLNKRRNAEPRSFEGFVYKRLVDVLFLHKNALECQATLRGHGATKKRPDKADKLAKEAKSRGIDTTGKIEAELKSAIADHERAKASRKGAKPGYGRRS